MTAILMLALMQLQIWWSLWMARRSMGYAFAVNWALMLVWFIVGMFVPLRLTAAYHRVHPFERSGRLYEAIGVRGFQRLLRASRFHSPRVFPNYAPGPDAAKNLIDATFGPETAHVMIFIVILVTAADVALRRGWWDTAAELLVFNVLLNAYPVLSLRHARVRATRLVARELPQQQDRDSQP